MSRAAPPPPTPPPIRPTAIELLDEVSRLPASERAARLESRCGGDGVLRAEVESLLAHLHAAPAFRSPIDLSRPGRPEHSPLAPGARVLRYRVERLLGEGGMGVVYLARQERPDRAVALKLIRPVAATPALIRRFAREAEMLGRLQHPGIAQIFEAGAADLGGGATQPFLAMEYVEGVPITEFARARALDARQRFELVGRLCEAVEHAHQRGLIHRDLKPANILVTAHGEPKILDFGVARAVDAAAPGATMATEVGVLVGTVAYMSPEQIGGRDRDSIDTRADIYALGVILYELLCGRLPHDTTGLELFEAARTVREEEPARPGLVNRSLRGDAETIILRAMARDRERRYASAGALREDIRRFLAAEPIAARQDSALYVLRKQLRRYRWGVTAAVVFVALLAGFAVWSSVQARAYRLLAASESAARSRIAEEERRAVEQLRAGNIERGRMLTLGGDLRGAERALWGAHAARPGADDAVWALRELYMRFPLTGTFNAGDGDLFSARFNPDGTLLATAGDRGLVQLWDAVGGGRLRTLTGHTQRLNSVRFSPDGTLLASGGLDSVIRLWRMPDGAPAGTLSGHTGSMHDMVFTRAGDRLYSWGQDNILRLWDVAARTLIRQTPPGRSSGWGVRLNAPETRVLTVDHAGWLQVRDALTLDLLHEIRVHPSSAISIAVSPDGTRVATGAWSGGIALWDPSNWTLLKRLDVDCGGVRALEFSPDGATLVATGTRATIAVDAQTLEPAATRLPAFRGGWCAHFSADGRKLVTTALGPGAARVWTLGDYEGRRVVAAHTGNVLALAVSPDGTRLATGTSEGPVALWNAATGAELNRWSARHYARIAAFDPGGRWMASGHSNGHIRLYSLDDDTPPASLREHTEVVDGLAWLPDGRLVSGCAGGVIRVWETPAGTELARLSAGGAVVAMAVSPDGKWIAANTPERIGQVWSAETYAAASPGADRAGSLIKGVAFSPDSRRLFLPSTGGPIEVWDALTATPLDQLNGHTRYVVRVAFSEDGRVMASAGQDGLLNFWEVATGRCLASLPTGEPDVQNMAWPRGSARLALTTGGGRLVLFDLAPLDARIRTNANAASPPVTPGS